jgi:hypothetical protein
MLRELPQLLTQLLALEMAQVLVAREAQLER